MMKRLVGVPKVLLQKIVFTVLIGAGCFLVGLSYFIFSHDRMFLLLSGVLLICSLYRSSSLYSVISKKKYEAVEGTCVGVSSKLWQKHFKIRIMDKDGVESTLYLAKKTKVKIGSLYRFYFNKAQQYSTGSEFVDTALATNQFLGFEELNELGKVDSKNQKQYLDTDF